MRWSLEKPRFQRLQKLEQVTKFQVCTDSGFVSLGFPATKPETFMGLSIYGTTYYGEGNYDETLFKNLHCTLQGAAVFHGIMA